MILFKEKYGSLEYDESVPCITATFLGFMSSEIFREFLQKGLKYLKEKKKPDEPILWLADTKKHQVQGAEDLKWVAEKWNPQALAIGVNCVAFVLPDNIFGEASIKNYSNIAKIKDPDKMHIEIFGDIDTAKDWFRKLRISSTVD
jgi:hypothetical protein